MYTEDMVREASQFDELFDEILELRPNNTYSTYSRDMNLLNGMNEQRGISSSFTFYNSDKTAAIQISIDSVLKNNEISYQGHIHYENNHNQKYYKYIIESTPVRYKRVLSKCIDKMLACKDLDTYFIPILKDINDCL